MKTKQLYGVLGLFILFFIFSGCKKDIFTPFYGSPNKIKKETDAWFHSISPSISGNVLNNTISRLSNLNFAHAIAIKDDRTGADFFIIQINDTDNKYDEYLSFKKINGEYKTIGRLKVFESDYENEIKNITSFFLSKRLAEDFRLSIYALNNRHFLTYEGVENNGLKIKKLESNKKGSFGAQRTNSSSMGLTCIDWYLVTTYTYSDGTQYQTEEYLYSTCNGDCEPSDPNLASLECWDQGGGGGEMGDNPSSITTVTNNLVNPCLLSVLSQITDTKIKTQITRFLIKPL